MFKIIAISFLLLSSTTPSWGILRIVSASVASDEILVELLSDQERQTMVVAYSTLAINPTYSNVADRVPAARALFGGSLEALLLTKPNLAFATSFNRPEVLQHLRVAGIKTIVLKDFKDWQDLRDNLLTIAGTIEKTKTGRQIWRGVEKRLKKLRAKRAGKTILGFSSEGILMGKGTMFDAITHVAGATNLAAEAGINGWQKVNAEVIARFNPDFLIVGSDQKADAVKQIQGAPGWSHMPAARNRRRIIVIPTSLLYSVSTHAVAAAERLQEALYATQR